MILSRLLIIAITCFSQLYCLSGQKGARFALLTDLHVGPGSVSDSNLHRIVEDINRQAIDFIIVSGDLSNAGSDDELYAVKNALDRLIRPVYLLPGNHETNWSESAGLTVNKIWGGDRFFFDFNGFTFVGYNTGPFMKMGDGIIRQEDLLWLREKLDRKTNRDNVLVSVSHYPLAEGLNNWNDVTGILKTAGCRLAFCGHGHRLSLYNFDGIPGIMGRAVLTGNSPTPGYSIVVLKSDSVEVYNKIIGSGTGKPALKLNYMKPDTLTMLPVSKLPDFSMNGLYPKLKPDILLTDTASIFTGPCLVNDKILIYGNSAGSLKAINVRTRRLLWQVKLPGPVYSTPVAAGNMVVLGTVGGKIMGIEVKNGRVLWNIDTGRPALAEGAAEGNYVYIGGGDRVFYKVNASDGNIVWQFDNVRGLIQGKPVITATSVVFGAWDQNLYSLDKNTGKLNWKWNNGKPQKLYSPGNIFPVSSDNKIFIVAPDRYMTALDLNSGKEIWRTGRHQVRESMGISPDGSTVYAKLMNDTVIAVSAYENYPLTKWAISAGFGYEHNPCPVLATGKSVIAATREGVLVAVDPAGQKIIWKYKAGNSSVNKAVADSKGRIWFTLTEGKIMSIDPRAYYP